jgi:hypothetical protein
VNVSAIAAERIAGVVVRSATAARVDVTAPTPEATLGGGAQSRTATAAQVNISAGSADRIAGSVVRSATAGQISVSAVAPSRIAGVVTRTATAASINISAPTATGAVGEGGITRQATAATVNVSAIAPFLISGAVFRSATAATIQISAPTPTTEGGVIVEPPPPPTPGASFVGVRRRVLRGRKYQEQIVDIFFALGAVVVSDRLTETYPRFMDVQVGLGMNMDAEGFSISGTIERPDLGLRTTDQDISDIIDLVMLGEI